MSRIETDPITVLANFNLEQQTNTAKNVRALFGLLDFSGVACSIYDLRDTADIHRHHSSIILRSLERLGIASATDPSIPASGGKTAYWTIHPDIFDVCRGYNYLYTHALRGALPGKNNSMTGVKERALRTFAVSHEMEHLKSPQEITTWFEDSLELQPEEIVRRALSSFAEARNVKDTVEDNLQAHIKQRTKIIKDRPQTQVHIPRQPGASDRAGTARTIGTTISSGRGLPARAPEAQRA